MENTKMIRTKEKIYQALIELTKTKKLNDLKVSEICREAAINRSTFYLHYQDITDLVDEIKVQRLNNLFEMVKNKRTQPKKIELNSQQTILINYQDVLESFHEARKNRELAMMLVGKNGDPDFALQLKENLVEMMAYFYEDYRDFLQEQFCDVPEDYLKIILFNTQAEIILHWVQKGMEESPEEIGRIITSTKIISPLSLLNQEK